MAGEQASPNERASRGLRLPDRRTGAIRSEGRIITPEMQRVFDKGVGPLNPQEVANRFASLQDQIRTGLQREGQPTRVDGGLLAIRTGIPPVTEEAWSKVVPGSKAFVADVAGTNWNIQLATKGGNGIQLDPVDNQSYDGDTRHVTFNEFASRIATPIAKRLKDDQGEGPVDIGISLGFPHENRSNESGIDALLTDVEPDGRMKKQWQITDWNPERSNITQALREQLASQGVHVGTVVAINDTPAVALDGEAVQKASQNGLVSLPVAFVGGTGTNGALDNNGLVNTEIGHAQWGESDADPVFQFMKTYNLTTAPEVDLEHETGMYLPFRLAAGIQWLSEEDSTFALDPNLFQQLISTDSSRDQTLISKVATGEVVSNEQPQQLAQAVLTRAGQVYGMALGAITEATVGHGSVDNQVKYAFPVEGGTLLKGEGIKDQAQKTASELSGQSITIVPAQGLKGVASLAMTYQYLQ